MRGNRRGYLKIKKEGKEREEEAGFRGLRGVTEKRSMHQRMKEGQTRVCMLFFLYERDRENARKRRGIKEGLKAGKRRRSIEWMVFIANDGLGTDHNSSNMN